MYYTEGMSCCAFRWTPYYNALHQWLHDVRTLCVHKKISFKYPVLIQDKTLVLHHSQCRFRLVKFKMNIKITD